MNKKLHVRPASANFATLFSKIHAEYLNMLRDQHHKLVANNLNLQPAFEKNDFMHSIFSTTSTFRQQSHRLLFKRLKQTKESQQSKCKVNYENKEQSKSFREQIERIKAEIKKKRKQRMVQEWLPIQKQLLQILALCRKVKQNEEVIKQFTQFEDRISDMLQYRQTRVVFYFVYAKMLELQEKEQCSRKQLQLLYLCDQYGRHLGYFWLTMAACFRIHRILLSFRLFQDSREYLRKALRLAIYLSSQNQEYRAIEMLKLMQYYEGNVTDNNQIYLKKSEKVSVIKNFHPLDDIKKEGKTKKPETCRTRTQIDQSTRYNYINFSKNMVFLRKNLTQRSQNLNETIKRVSRIGYIQKYEADGTHSQIKPHYQPQQNKSQQILLTQLKKNNKQLRKKNMIDFYLRVFVDMLASICSDPIA